MKTTPKTYSIGAKVSQETYDALSKQAKIYNTTIANIVREAVVAYLEE